jgi:hypothetical protein
MKITKYVWKEAKVLQIEANTTYRKCKEVSHMPLADHLISHPSLDFSPIYSPIIAAEVSNYNSGQWRLQ